MKADRIGGPRRFLRFVNMRLENIVLWTLACVFRHGHFAMVILYL